MSEFESQHSEDKIEKMRQFSTFFLANRMYGIDVMQVQEIVKPLQMTPIPLAPNYVYGLINLRGQIATAIGLREMFGLESISPDQMMNVIGHVDNTLVSFLVDEIGDVIDVNSELYEPTPETVPLEVRQFIDGVYKIPGQLLSILNLENIMKHLNSIQKNK